MAEQVPDSFVNLPVETAPRREHFLHYFADTGAEVSLENLDHC